MCQKNQWYESPCSHTLQLKQKHIKEYQENDIRHRHEIILKNNLIFKYKRGSKKKHASLFSPLTQ